MTIADQVTRSGSPQEALLAIARGLDRIEAALQEAERETDVWHMGWVPQTDPSGRWFAGDPQPREQGYAADPGPPTAPSGGIRRQQADGSIEFVLPKPSDEKRERRRALAR